MEDNMKQANVDKAVAAIDAALVGKADTTGVKLGCDLFDALVKSGDIVDTVKQPVGVPSMQQTLPIYKKSWNVHKDANMQPEDYKVGK